MNFPLVLFIITIGFQSSTCHRPLHSHAVEESNLIRPCALHDMECMRKFLATNGNCIIKRNAPKDPLHVPRREAKLPSFNATLLLRNLTFYGFSRSRVVEFGQSRTTGNLVIALLYKTRHTEFVGSMTFHRRAQESITITDTMVSDAKSITVTMVIPRVPHLHLQDAEVSYYAGSTDFKLTVGPNYRNTRDKHAQRLFAAIMDDLPTAFMEELVTTPASMTTAFIQEFLCDFGDRSTNYYFDH